MNISEWGYGWERRAKERQKGESEEPNEHMSELFLLTFELDFPLDLSIIHHDV
jgi:hypothetical protein